jgi:hypothetical protein
VPERQQRLSSSYSSIHSYWRSFRLGVLRTEIKMSEEVESKEETPTLYQKWFGRSKVTEVEVILFGKEN